jgi:lipopolysaccharide export system protein LptA
MRRVVSCLLGLLASVFAAGSAGAQRGANRPTPCELVAQPETRLSSDSIPGLGQIAFIGGGVLMKCPQRGITLRGDSAERYPDHDQIIGHAVYDEPRVHVTANYLNYFPADERVVGAGDVHATLPTGSTLVGPQAELRRAVPRVRPRQQISAIARPTITIVEKDSAGKTVPPTTVVANTVFMDGDSLIYAGGQVVITRPEIVARADSVFIDDAKETMRLMRQPVLTGQKDRPFTLRGDLIDLFSHNRKLQRVLARANATAVSDSMTLKSDTIDLRVQDDLLSHAYAWSGEGKDRAVVVSPTQHLTADSLDVTMPGQRIRLVRALRTALAQGKPDTTHFKVVPPDTMDWLRGDTIVAQFDSLSARDTTKNPAIRRLTSSGHASALYHLAPSDTSLRRPAINHVTARVITVLFDDQHKVSTVTTVDSVAGVYIEPKPDSTGRKPTAGAPAKVPPPPIKPPLRP